MDSETPSIQPYRYMMQTTLTITITTQRIERMARIIFAVAISKIIKAKTIAIAIPCIAEETKAFSEGIHAQASGATCSKYWSPSGATSLLIYANASNLSKWGYLKFADSYHPTLVWHWNSMYFGTPLMKPSFLVRIAVFPSSFSSVQLSRCSMYFFSSVIGKVSFLVFVRYLWKSLYQQSCELGTINARLSKSLQKSSKNT